MAEIVFTVHQTITVRLSVKISVVLQFDIALFIVLLLKGFTQSPHVRLSLMFLFLSFVALGRG